MAMIEVTIAEKLSVNNGEEDIDRLRRNTFTDDTVSTDLNLNKQIAESLGLTDQAFQDLMTQTLNDSATVQEKVFGYSVVLGRTLGFISVPGKTMPGTIPGQQGAGGGATCDEHSEYPDTIVFTCSSLPWGTTITLDFSYEFGNEYELNSNTILGATYTGMNLTACLNNYFDSHTLTLFFGSEAIKNSFRGFIVRAIYYPIQLESAMFGGTPVTLQVTNRIIEFREEISDKRNPCGSCYSCTLNLSKVL